MRMQWQSLLLRDIPIEGTFWLRCGRRHNPRFLSANALISLGFSESNKLVLFRRCISCRFAHFIEHHSLLVSVRVCYSEALAHSTLENFHGSQQGALNLSRLLHLICLDCFLLIYFWCLIDLYQLMARYQLLLRAWIWAKKHTSLVDMLVSWVELRDWFLWTCCLYFLLRLWISLFLRRGRNLYF